jgi:dCTP deaminase
MGTGPITNGSASRPGGKLGGLFRVFQSRRGPTMGILPDWLIERDVKIEPFAPQQHRPGVISYGVTSYGYDVRVDKHFKVFTNVWGSTVDPKNFDPKSFVDVVGDYCIIPPNSFALAETVEYLEIPRDILVVCVGKSTYARCGIIVNVTPLEPEWRGRVTIEISNTTPLPAKIYAGEGIAQMLFFRGEQVCKVSYADKKGKYQDQKGLTLPFVSGTE